MLVEHAKPGEWWLPGVRHGEWALPAARRREYRAQPAEGLCRCRTVNWKHGRYSAEALAERRRIRDLLDQSAAVLRSMRTGGALEGLVERLFAGIVQGVPGG